MKSRTLCLVVLAVLTLVAGCGSKGPLYLPPGTQPLPPRNDSAPPLTSPVPPPVGNDTSTVTK